jgi:hypothetical protein
LVLLFTYCSDLKIALQWEHVIREVNDPNEIYELYHQTILEFYKGNIPKDKKFSYEDFRRNLDNQMDSVNDILFQLGTLQYFSEEIIYEATNGEEQKIKILVGAGKYSMSIDLTMIIDLV